MIRHYGADERSQAKSLSVTPLKNALTSGYNYARQNLKAVVVNLFVFKTLFLNRSLIAFCL